MEMMNVKANRDRKTLEGRFNRVSFAVKADQDYFALIMKSRFDRGFDDYWHWFGYEIGGPVCYAFVNWIIGTLREKHPEVSGLAFVARDGWLLRQVYQLLTRGKGLPESYVYAPRSVCLKCQDPLALQDYQTYFSGKEFGCGTIGVVDTVTMKFSSLRLIDSVSSQATLGLFWLMLRGAKDYTNGLCYEVYQQENYHMISCWNLMEFIMTSPEPPIDALDSNGMPVFVSVEGFEQERAVRFTALERGTLEFAKDVIAGGRTPAISNADITCWVNDFLKHPDVLDRMAFADVMVSERADHSDRQLMNPFHDRMLSPKEWKDALWFYSQKHPVLYTVLHWGKKICKQTLDSLRSITSTKFDPKAISGMVSMLSKYDYVSFDIFDTLVFRSCDKPTDLFYQLEKEQGIHDFHDMRIQAEHDARQLSGKPNGEVNINDIYAILKKHYNLNVEAAIRAEVDAEIGCCYANPEIHELYKVLLERGCRMIATSDMYLPSAYLRELLDKCGYTEIKPIFVSCEHGVGKNDGNLQRCVQSTLDVTGSFIHIGDNFKVDVLESKKAGWGAVYYCVSGKKYAKV